MRPVQRPGAAAWRTGAGHSGPWGPDDPRHATGSLGRSPRDLTVGDAAATIGRAVGRPIAHRHIATTEFVAIRSNAGVPADYATRAAGAWA